MDFRDRPGGRSLICRRSTQKNVQSVGRERATYYPKGVCHELVIALESFSLCGRKRRQRVSQFALGLSNENQVLHLPGEGAVQR